MLGFVVLAYLYPIFVNYLEWKQIRIIIKTRINDTSFGNS